MNYDPDIVKKFLANCAQEGIELRVFDGRNVKDFAGFQDGGYEQVFVAFDETHTGTDQDLIRRMTDLIREQRDSRIALRYEPWPLKGVAVSLADLERAFEASGAAQLREQHTQHHLIGLPA